MAARYHIPETEPERLASPAAQPDRPRSARLHPLIYKTMTLLALGFVLAAWGLAGKGYSRLELAVLTAFVTVVVVLLVVVAHIRRRRPGLVAEGAAAPRSFRDWARGELATAAGLVEANLATVEILLPILAVVVGLAALAIVRGIAVG